MSDLQNDPNEILPQPSPQEVAPEGGLNLPVGPESGAGVYDELSARLNLPTSLWHQRKYGLDLTPPISEIENLTRAIASSPDPMGEINKVRAAQFLGERMKIPVAAAYANFDRLSEIFMGKAMPPATFLEGIRDHWKNGVTTFEINEVGNTMSMTGDPAVRQRLLEQVGEMRKRLIPIKDTPKFFALKWLDWVVDSAPQMLESMVAGGTMSMLASGTAGAMLGALGAPATLGISIPAMAAAMGSVGLVVGTTQAMSQNMKGAEYLRMVEAGVPHNVAGVVSTISGYVQGSLESAGELLVGLPFVPFKSIGERIAGKILLTGFGFKTATDIAIRLLAAGGGEGIENSLQYLTQAAADQLAIELSKDPNVKLDTPTTNELLREFGNQFYQGFGAGIIFGVAGFPRGVRADVRQMGAIQRLAMIMPDKESFVSAVKDAKIGSGNIQSEAWKSYLGRVYDRQQIIVKEALAKRNAQEAEAPGAPAAVPVPTAGVQTTVQSEGTGPAGARSILVAGDIAAQKRFAFIRYSTEGNTITVNQVINEPGYTLDRQMMMELMRKNPGKTIVWNPIEEGQLELRDELVAANPLGPEAGINWFGEETVQQQQAAAAVTVEDLQQAFQKTYALTPEQAKFFAVFAERRARKRGVSVNTWLSQRVAPGVVNVVPGVQEAMANRVNPETGLPEPAIAATTFTRAGQVVGPLQLNVQGLQEEVLASFAAMQGADFHHAVHEYFHMIERLDLTPEEIGLFELALGRPRAMWTEAMIEELANKFEDYLATGRAPTPELQSLFQRIAEMFKALVSYLRGEGLLSPEFTAAYDALFVNPEAGINQPEAQAPAEVPVQSEEQIMEANGFQITDENRGAAEIVLAGAQVNTENGPAGTDSVILPPALYHIRDIEGWEKQVTEYMAANGFTPDQIKVQVQNMVGQMKLFNALGPHEIEFFPVGANEITHRFPNLHVRKKEGTSEFAGFGPIRGNADPIYKVTFDASAMCPKRLATAATALWAQGKLNRALTASERLALVSLFKMNGKTAPCIYCYVESPRGKAVEFVGRAQAIVRGEVKIPEGWSPASKDQAAAAIAEYKKNPVELDPNLFVDPAYTQTPEAREKIAESPAVYRFIATQYNSAKSNMPKLYEAYDAHILYTPAEVIQELNNYAGFRFFSSSDFQMEHIVDLMQAFNDLQVKGAKSHSYSKVVDFIELFGATGQKINASIFAKMENGQIVEDTWQGLGWAEAQRLRAKFKDVGTILVATSDAIVDWGLDQPWIDYIIPFHYSGLEKKFYETLDWADFTSSQKEQWARDQTGKRPKKGKVKQIRMYELNTAEGITNQELSARYLALCRERGLEPVFSKWQDHPEFGKLKKDYARTDTPFEVTTANFDMTKVQQILDKVLAGEAPQATPDLVVGKQLLQKIREFSARPGEDIGVEALQAVQRGMSVPPVAGAGEIRALFHADEKAITTFNAKAEKAYGFTQDPEYGRWILSTGKMLNFRLEPLAVKRPHQDIAKILKGMIPETMTAYHGAWWHGAVRMDLVDGELTLESYDRPNAAQMKTIAKFIDKQRVLFVEIHKEGSHFRKLEAPNIQLLEDFYNAAEFYTETGETHLFHPKEENPILANLVDTAAQYETAEAFRADMEKAFGEATPGALEAYTRIWNAAHPLAVPGAVEPPAAPAAGIPLPESAAEEQYNFEDKLDLAQEVADPALAQRVETGDLTEAQVDEAIGRSSEVSAAARAELAAAEVRQLELTTEERSLVEDAEQLQQLPKRSLTAAAKAKRLISRIATALKKNPAMVDLVEDLKTELAEDKALQKAIADARLAREKTRAGEKLAKVKESAKEAKARIRAQEAERRRELRTRLYTERRAAMRKFRETIMTAVRNRMALQKFKETRKRLIKAIMAPVSSAIEYRGYADRIQLIQRQIDPRTHRVATLEERAASRAFFDSNPDAAALVPEKTLEKIYSVPVQTLTLAELEQLHTLIEGLKKLGRLKRSLIVGQHKRWRVELQRKMANAILRGEPLEKVVGAAKGSPAALRLWLLGLKPGRVARLLDGVFAGVTEHGPFWELLQDRPNIAWNAMRRSMDKRHESVISQLDRLHITLDPFAVKRLKGYTYLGAKVDIDGFKYSDGSQPTYEEVMYWYLGIQNEKTRAALEHGNNLPMDIMQKAIDLLPKNLKALADLISVDFDSNFERYREAFIDNFNEDLPREDHYITMNRKERSYKTREEKVAAELTGRSGFTKHYVDRGSTHARIEISDDHQTPIATNLMGIWMEAVRDQEGFIYQDMMIKDMHSILGSDEVRKPIQQKYGPAMNEWLRKYTNDLAQDEAYQSQLSIEKWSRIARSNAAIAWLSFNLLSASKQFIGWINALADAGPLHLASAAAQLAAAQGKGIVSGITGHPWNNALVDWVMERSPMIKHRMISQEFEDLRRINQAGYQQLVKKIGSLGMKGLEIMDMTAVVIGWKAVYDKQVARGATPEEAIKAADETTVRTQPSMRVQDTAEMYRGGEALKWFTMFTSDLNSTFNRMAFDVPAALRNGQILFAFSDMLTFAIAGAWIAVASGAFSGSDDEKKRKKLIMGVFSQYFEALPFVGNDVWAALSGKTFQSGGVKIFPAITYIQSIPHELGQGEWDKAVTNLAEALGFAVGLPVSGVRRGIKFATTGEAESLLGWPVKKE